MPNILNNCPVCSSNLVVTCLRCPTCDTSIEGHFLPRSTPFAHLSPEQEQFLLNYIRCEGRFNRLEEELNLSYPTLRNRLNELIWALGFEPGREEARPRMSAEERTAVLEDLNQGKITFEEAQRRLHGEEIVPDVEDESGE